MRPHSREVRQLLERLVAGCEVSHTRGGHVRVRLGPSVVFMPSSPSDGRAMKNARADLRRAGMIERA